MTVLEYIAGLTSYALDEQVFERIAIDRQIDLESDPALFTQKTKDLLLADILYTIYVGGSNIPSFAHQHGQFSTSTGSQTIPDKEKLFDQMIRLYRKWGDPRADLFPQTSGLNWME